MPRAKQIAFDPTHTAQFFTGNPKCRQVNRIAASRYGTNTIGITFLRDDAPLVVAGESDFADTKEAALEKINALQPEGAKPLKEKDVYIHYIEAANDSFVEKYFCFFGETTLRNMERDAKLGIAFQNSHRDGGMSTDAELPFGKSFDGLYREEIRAGKMVRRCLMGIYMLRGLHPNGASGPSTDDLHRMIEGGSVFDVSVGLHGGEMICNVCGQDMMAVAEGEWVCPHYPGSTRAMTDEQKAAARELGVPGGKASFTLGNATTSEVSAVYAGAVTGAGVQRVLQGWSELESGERRELALTFSALLPERFTRILLEEADAVPSEESKVQSGQSQLSSLIETISTKVADKVAAKINPLHMTATTEGGVMPKEVVPQEETQIVGVLADSNHEDRLTAADTELAEQKRVNAELTAKVKKQEDDARRTQFRLEVKGTGSGATVQWVGKEEEHVEHLMSLSGAFGDDSKEVKHYVATMRAASAQLLDNESLKDFGSSLTAGNTAEARLETIAEEIQKAEGVTIIKARALATERNPKLVAESRAGK